MVCGSITRLFCFAAVAVAVLGLGVKAGDPEVRPDKPVEIAKPKVARGFQWAAHKAGFTVRSGKRNHLYYAGEPISFELGETALRFVVRNYWGEIVDEGPAKGKIDVKAQPPGWYKLYVFGKAPPAPKKRDPLEDLLDGPAKLTPQQVRDQAGWDLWGTTVAATTFTVFRSNPNFPVHPGPEEFGGNNGILDEVIRGVTGMGPQRHQADLKDVDETIKNLERDLEIDRKLYLPFDPARKRCLMVAFGNGTKDLDAVRKIVEHFKDYVEYWEPRNEPNFGAGPAGFIENEMKPFYDVVKSVSPKLKVLGPGIVSVTPSGGMLAWMDGFLKEGGAKYIDGLSFHAYNCIDGDVWLARQCMEGLDATMKKYNVGHLEKWQTEQGYFACVYGAYQPRLQGRWTMVQMMVYEQYGLPKEHNVLWYDRSHGFWDFPTWWENDDGGVNAAVPLMRVWSEELFGTTYTKAYDFGPSGNNIYVGSLFSGKGKRVAAFMSAGATDGQVKLKVKGTNSLQISSAFGVESTVPVVNGLATVAVPELPVYVRLPAGQEVEVVPCDWGPNLALTPGTKAAYPGCNEHPSTRPDTPLDQRINNDIGKIVNGLLENWYGTQRRDDHPWMSNVRTFPTWVDVRLPAPAQVGRVVVYASPPWQSQGTLLDYDLQVDQDGKWVTVDTVKEPTKTFRIYTPTTRTLIDSYFSERWIFQHQFKPVTTSKIRLQVRDVTWGGGAVQDVGEIGGQTGPHQIVLREIEIYGK